MSRGLIVDH